MKKSFYLFHLLTLCFIFCAGASRAQGPSITSNPANDTVCAGSSAWFAVMSSDTAATYVWEKSADGTTWDTVSGATRDTLRLSAVTSAMNGMQYRAFAVDTFASAPSTAATLVVNSIPGPGVITGASLVCLHGTTTLSDTVTGGAWSSSNTAAATITSGGVVNGVALGTTTIKYKVTNSCGSDSTTFNVTVGTTTAGAIHGATHVCVGFTTALTDSVSGASWVSLDTTGTVSSAGVVTGAYNGNDTILYINTNSCGTDTARFVITVGTSTVRPITGATKFCLGATTTLHDSTASGTWSSSDTTIACISSTGVLTGRAAGVVTVTYTAAVACGTASVYRLDTFI